MEKDSHLQLGNLKKILAVNNGLVLNTDEFIEKEAYILICDGDSEPTGKTSSLIIDPNTSLGGTSPIALPKFETIEAFYKALKNEDLDEDEIQEIRSVFIQQKIKSKHLPRLNDEKLEKYGIIQGGLREAILSVLGK